MMKGKIGNGNIEKKGISISLVEMRTQMVLSACTEPTLLHRIKCQQMRKEYRKVAIK